MIWIEAVAVAFGILCVWLTVRQNIWCWPAGLVQVSLYVVIFYDVKLYSDLILHVIYVGMQLYGWHHWLHGGPQNTGLRVTSLSPLARVIWVAGVLFASWIWGALMITYTDAAAPYFDAFIAAASLAAQWLLARKRLESWYLWIAVDVVGIGVYWYKQLVLTTGLYVLFLGLAVSGLVAWRRSMRVDGSDGT